MHPKRVQKGIVGLALVLVVVAGGVFLATSLQKSDEKHREVLETILRGSDKAPFGNISRNTPFYDGGAVSAIEASYDNSDVSQVQTDLQQRLEAEGFRLVCPGGRDSPAETLQKDTMEPRQQCAVSGHGAEGTVWLGTSVAGTQMSAIVRF